MLTVTFPQGELTREIEACLQRELTRESEACLLLVVFPTRWGGCPTSPPSRFRKPCMGMLLLLNISLVCHQGGGRKKLFSLEQVSSYLLSLTVISADVSPWQGLHGVSGSNDYSASTR